MGQIGSFLFTDIEGSTALLQRIGREKYAALLAIHHRLVTTAVQGHGGVVEGIEGDGVFASFDTPSAAVAAAVDAQRAIAAAWGGEAVLVRMGVHTGEAERESSGWVGLAVHHAARVTAAANGGQVLISSATAALIEDPPAGVCFRELGIYQLKDLPRPERLHQVIGDGMPVDSRPPRATEAARTNLPVPLTAFVGRHDELAALRKLMDEHRAVTVTGAGGAGKTRLALEVAGGMAGTGVDAVYLVELAPVDSGAGLGDVLAMAVGVAARVTTDPIQAAAERLVRERALLVLDNCEHLLDAAATAADRLLRACPDLRVLATSREPLGLAGEATWRIPSLSLPTADAPVEDLQGSDAVRLFLARVRDAAPDRALDADEVVTVASICRRLDGIPLAIELAAARFRTLTAAQVAARLDDTFRLLTGGSRTALPRQQTLRATIEWSHQLLSPAERATFRRLAVFVDSFTLDAAEAVCADELVDELDVVDVLGSLVDKSMVQPADPGADGRFRLLAPMRQFAAEELLRSGEAEAARRRHLEWYVARAREDEWALRRADEATVRRYAAELENIEAALVWAIDQEPDSAEALFGLTWFAWFFPGIRPTWLRWAERLTPALDAADSEDRVRCLMGVSWALSESLQRERAATNSERALGMARRLGLHDLTAACASQLAYHRALLGADREALALAAEAVTLGDASGRPELKAVTRVQAARVHLQAGRLDAAEVLAAEAAELPDLSPMNDFLVRLTVAELAVERGRFDDGIAGLEALIGQTTGADGHLARMGLAAALVGAGRLADARRALAEVAQWTLRNGDLAAARLAVHVTAGLASASGDHALAARLLGASELDGRSLVVRPIFAGLRKRATAAALEALGSNAFDAEVAVGRTWPLDRAVRAAGLG